MKDKDDLISDIQNLKEFEKVPIYTERNGQFFTDRNFEGIVFLGELEILSTVSKRYKLIQFREVFLPILNNIPDFEGEIDTYKGKANLFVFPTDNSEERVGILLRNSVDKSSAIEIRFCVLINGHFITIPSQIKQFRKVHTGKALQYTLDFADGLTAIQDTWKTVVSQYKSYEIAEETKESIVNELKLTKTAKKAISELTTGNLWELFIAVLEQITKRNYRSNIHKQKKIDRVSQLFYNFSIGLMV